MANISSIGIGSGILTSDLIEKLVAAEREPTELRLNQKQESVEAKISALGRVQSALTDLRLPARVLSNPDSIRSLSVSASGSGVTASAETNAAKGNYNVSVSALAQAHSLKTGAYTDKNITTLGTGTLTIDAAGIAVNVTIDSSNNTLEGIADAINEKSSVGVTASVIDTGSGFVLALTSKETGLDNAISITVTDNDGNSTDTSGLSQLASANLTTSVTAQDASFSVNGVGVTRATNTVDDVISGLTLTLTDETTSPVTLSVKNDDDLVVERVTEFVDKFNALKEVLNELTAYDPSGSSSGVFIGDFTMRTINTQLRSTLSQVVSGLSGSSVTSLAELGISTNNETGLLSINENTLKSALDANLDDVVGVFADQGRTSDAQVSFVRAGLKTVAGAYDIEITQAATNGTNTGSVVLGASTVIDADNDELKLSVDGISTNLITLTNNSYTPSGLVTELQTQLDADTNLKNAGKSVIVSLDGSGQLKFTSSSYGSNSTVAITQVDTDTLADLGLSVGSGTDGLNVEGSINGATATGDGQILTAATGDDSEGISIKVSGTATGSRGTVTYIEGVAEQLVDQLNDILGIDGIISNKETTFDKQLESIAKERASMESRIASLQSRLATQFTSADILVSNLNSTADFLTSQLAALTGSKDD